MTQRRTSGQPTAASSSPSASPRLDSSASATGALLGDSDEEDSVDEDDFEAVPGQQAALAQSQQSEKEQKKRLHEMEVNEAAALKFNMMDEDEDDEDEGGGDDEDGKM
jgi:hypothetical protein